MTQKEDRELALFQAAIENDIEAAKRILAEGSTPYDKANIDAAGPYGSLGATALNKAVQLGHVDMARFLLEHGADVNHKHAFDQTPLMDAAASGKRPMVEFLLEKGAHIHALNVDDQDNKGEEKDKGLTALSFAVLYGHTEVATLLIAHGARTDVITQEKQSLLDLAVQSNSMPMVSMLTEQCFANQPEAIENAITASEKILSYPTPVKNLETSLPIYQQQQEAQREISHYLREKLQRVQDVAFPQPDDVTLQMNAPAYTLPPVAMSHDSVHAGTPPDDKAPASPPETDPNTSAAVSEPEAGTSIPSPAPKYYAAAAAVAGVGAALLPFMGNKSSAASADEKPQEKPKIAFKHVATTVLLAASVAFGIASWRAGKAASQTQGGHSI